MLFRNSARCLSTLSRVFQPMKTEPSDFHKLIEIRPDIQDALENNEPVVALESTIITHGMPYPSNIETASIVEEEVILQGAVPATIAIMNGKIKVGLQRHELKKLAGMPKEEVIKCSRRDLPYLVATKKSGGTTVAATMIIAEMCGIKIFATGGIGGVHRDGHVTMDISADLVELGRTPIAVVSSGVKSILDIPRTLEYLETQGVCVATYGDADGKFPDFYTTDSGLRVAYNCANPREAADLIAALNDLKLKSGILIAVPIPEAHSARKDILDEAINCAYRHAVYKNIRGKDITPFLLEAINELTAGQSLEANKALIKNNASVAAKIACELSAQYWSSKGKMVRSKIPTPTIIGGSILDLSMTLKEDEALEFNGATYQVKAKQSPGGVGRNLAVGLFNLHGNANFITAIGTDHIGKTLLNLMPDQLKSYVHVDEKEPTSICTVMFDKTGDCKLHLGNMEIHETISPELLHSHEKLLTKSPLILMDANLSLPTMEKLFKIAAQKDIPIFFEPTDMLIANKPFRLPRELTKQIKIISPNVFELKAIAQSLTNKTLDWKPDLNAGDTSQILNETKKILELIADKFDCVIVTLGHHGVVLSLRDKYKTGFFEKDSGKYVVDKSDDNEKPKMIFYPAPKVDKIVNVSGAGDSFNCGFIAQLLNGDNIDTCVAMGFVAAKKALQSDSAVPNRYFSHSREKTKSLHETMELLKPEEI